MWPRNKLCELCLLPVMNEKFDPMIIPCSKYHVRCLRCHWPVAQSFIDEDNICTLCKRQNYEALKRKGLIKEEDEVPRE